MEWNNNTNSLGSNLTPFLPTRPENPLAFLFRYNNFDQPPNLPPPRVPGLEVRHGVGFEDDPRTSMDTNDRCQTDFHNYYCGNNLNDKKKRLTCDQLESLERSFLEEIKLDPDRKMRLARDLGLQPRQIAVWFQNRRARWKNKELERLYDTLKQKYDVVSREKQMLEEEVVKLQALLREEHHCMKNQVSTTGYCNENASGEETIESAAAVAVNRRPEAAPHSLAGCHRIIDETNNYFNNEEEDYIPLLPVQLSYWQGCGHHQLPPYP